MNSEQQIQATASRSLRNIRSELEYLSDIKVITAREFAALVALLPSQPLSSGSVPSPTPIPTPTPTPTQLPLPLPVRSQPASASYDEKSPALYENSTTPVSSPPSYTSTVPLPSLDTAIALYEYQPSDAGDLAILPKDRIFITEYMNADWAKGRSERTGFEGIFPRTYVQVAQERKLSPLPPPTPSNYGNLPLDVSQSGGGNGGPGGKESALNANGKKFGKKLGNATIFGAGATVGSKIVNGIF